MMTKLMLNRRAAASSLTRFLLVPTFPLWNFERAFAQGSKRVLFVYLPNGFSWQPTALGGSFELPLALNPLAPYRDHVTIVSGVNLPAAKDNKPGDHARAGGSFLTCVKPAFPGPGVARSFDHLIADAIGKDTPHRILSLGGEGGSGSDAGYSDSYQSHISWAQPNTPYAKETSPKAVFERLFGPLSSFKNDPRGSSEKVLGEDKKVLEFAKKETQDLRSKLNPEDRQKLDEYLTSLSDLESRLGGGVSSGQPRGGDLECSTPSQTPRDNLPYDARIQHFYQIIFHAFQCGLTNVVTFMLGNEASGISYPFAGVSGSHHEISHDSSTQGQEKLAKIVQWHTKQLAQLIDRLAKTREGTSTMLDHTLILYGSGLGDGARHTHENLPLVVIGKDGLGIPGGRHIHAQGAPLANLHMTLAKSLGMGLDRFGDSTGILNLG